VSVTPQHAADGALPAPNADCVRIDVADNGPGIAPDVMAALFTPFTTTKPNGLGLGLVISRDIAADFGGELQAHSEPGVGTRFTLLLQRARPS
jgi:two-component system C4-dicarboxylate transport sensor histidine kinase DctB